MNKFNYPNARRDEAAIDIYHGTEIKDPYRWLENPDSDETKAFVDAQNNASLPYIRGCPKRQVIQERLTQIWNYPKYSCPFKGGDKYYFFMNTGLQNQQVLYVQDSLDDNPRVFFDPNTLSEEGTIALDDIVFSQDGSVVAYFLTAGGSDWSTIHFLNAKTGKKYFDILENVKYTSATWTHDNKGIFYACYPHKTAENSDNSGATVLKNQRLFYHKVGTPQSEDVLVVDFPKNPLWTIQSLVTHCGRWLIVTAQLDSETNSLYFSKLNSAEEIKGKLELTEVVGTFEANYYYVTSAGTKAIFVTNKNAPNSKLMSIDLENFQKDNWSELIAEHPRNVLTWASVVDEDKIVLCYSEDVKSVLKVYSLATGRFLKDLRTDPGSIMHFAGNKKSSKIFYGFESFLTPESIYTVDLKTDEAPKVYRETKVTGFDASLYKTTQVFYPSKDGTQIPMFIVFKKNIALNGSSPCLMCGYGGFGDSEVPSFKVYRTVFMQHLDGVIAIANIRGGGEYGEKWHNAGAVHNKQNVFDDFQYAAKYLIEHGYTSSKKIVIEGRSNGGLLVAACVNQRPDLFGAAIAGVGVMDMLKYHKFTIGQAWVSEYGSSDDPEQFKTLLKYSPLHNVKPPEDGSQYPSILLLTADHDDRVVPSHSLKLIATLQHEIGRLPQQTNPLLAMIEVDAGHEEEKATSKAIEEKTDVLTFIIQALNLELK